MCISYLYIFTLQRHFGTNVHSSSALHSQKPATFTSLVSRLCAAASWSRGFIQTCAIYINGQKSPPCDWSLLLLQQHEASLRHHPGCRANKVSLLQTEAGPTGPTVPCCVKGHHLDIQIYISKNEQINRINCFCSPSAIGVCPPPPLLLFSIMFFTRVQHTTAGLCVVFLCLTANLKDTSK